MDREEYLRRWSALHGQAATTGLVRYWLSLTHVVARPFAHGRVSPDVLTVLGLLVACSVVPIAAAGGRWPLLAAAVVVASGLLDNLDGAVAVMTGRTTRWGFVLDSVCDRVADSAYVTALWLLGAPGLLCVFGGGLAGLHEYTRARATAGGMVDIAVITVSERPTRVIVTTMFLLGAGLYPAAAGSWASAGAAAWAVLGGIGLLQLLVVARRELRS
jgi:CDP-diacylglycerol--glycerol-3-phosphate 3-phosphatidyltransferase